MRPVTPKKYCLLGKPINHSLSPLIHRSFAQQFGLQISYDLLAVEPAEVFAAITTFFSNGGYGMNITAPYKELVFKQLKHLTPDAQAAGAVNTIVLQEDGSICGANTDGVGLLLDFKRNNIQIAGKNIIILGAGGAVRGIMPHLIQAQANSIVVFNRTLLKAQRLSLEFGKKNVYVQPYAELSAHKADVVIHAISSNAEALPIYKKINYSDTVCYDLNYAAKSSIFLDFAAANGAKRMINGLGMLIEQAAAAFKLWHNCTPATQPIFAQIQHIYQEKSVMDEL